MPDIWQEKSGGKKTAAEFGWDTSKLQKITLFQAHMRPCKEQLSTPSKAGCVPTFTPS